MTNELTAEKRRMNPIDARLNALVRSVSGWSALIVGALTVTLAHEITEYLALSEFYEAIAVFPITLAVIYVLLALAARLEGGEP